MPDFRLSCKDPAKRCQWSGAWCLKLVYSCAHSNHEYASRQYQESLGEPAHQFAARHDTNHICLEYHFLSFLRSNLHHFVNTSCRSKKCMHASCNDSGHYLPLLLLREVQRLLHQSHDRGLCAAHHQPSALPRARPPFLHRQADNAALLDGSCFRYISKIARSREQMGLMKVLCTTPSLQEIEQEFVQHSVDGGSTQDRQYWPEQPALHQSRFTPLVCAKTKTNLPLCHRCESLLAPPQVCAWPHLPAYHQFHLPQPTLSK